MKLFELLNRSEVSVEWRGVGSAADAGQVGAGIVRPGIGNGASRRGGRGHIGKRVDEVRQIVGNAILLQVGDVVSGVVNAPLFEVTAQNLGFVCLVAQERGMQMRKTTRRVVKTDRQEPMVDRLDIGSAP